MSDDKNICKDEGVEKHYSEKDGSIIRKGGLNNPPKTYRPSEPPKGQQKSSEKK